MNNEKEFYSRYCDNDKNLIQKMYSVIGNEKRRLREASVLSHFNDVSIKKVVYNNNATIVFWSDNTKTVTRCNDDDNYNQEYALMMCVLKKLHSTKNISRFLEVWTNHNIRGTITVKDVRKKEKEND